MRPHLIKLLDTGQVSFHKTGSRRRILFRDLMDYSKLRDAARKSVPNILPKGAVADGLYDASSIPDGGEDE